MIAIRPLNAADAASFQALRQLATQTSPTSFIPTPEEEASQTLDKMATRIQSGDTQTVFGAFSGDELIAITGLSRNSWNKVRHKAMIWGVFVHPDHRRLGIAQQLLQTAENHASEQWGCLQLTLCVNTENQAAKTFYEEQGFTRFGTEPRAMLVGGCFYDEDHMSKALR